MRRVIRCWKAPSNAAPWTRDDAHNLAQRMYEFCPDIVDQGRGDVEALAESLARSDDLFFWWD